MKRFALQLAWIYYVINTREGCKGVGESASIIGIGSRGAKSPSATVQFESQHRYKTTDSKVAGMELVNFESGGKRLRHLWRSVDTSSAQMGGASSVSMPAICSHSSDLGSRHEAREPGPVEAPQCAGKSSSGVCRIGFRSKMDLYSCETKPDRPLAFSRHN
jgi:hypothetical protein